MVAPALAALLSEAAGQECGEARPALRSVASDERKDRLVLLARPVGVLGVHLVALARPRRRKGLALPRDVGTFRDRGHSEKWRRFCRWKLSSDGLSFVVNCCGSCLRLNATDFK